MNAEEKQVTVSQYLEKEYKVLLKNGKKPICCDNINVLRRKKDLSFVKTIQQLQDYFASQQMNVHFWKKATREKKRLVAYPKLSRNHEFSQIQHLLIMGG